MYPTTLFVGVREAAPMNKVKISMHVSNEIQVAHNQNVLKLPNGINFVTIMRPAHGQHIEVRLPLTGKRRFLSFHPIIETSCASLS